MPFASTAKQAPEQNRTRGASCAATGSEPSRSSGMSFRAGRMEASLWERYRLRMVVGDCSRVGEVVVVVGEIVVVVVVVVVGEIVVVVGDWRIVLVVGD